MLRRPRVGNNLESLLHVGNVSIKGLAELVCRVRADRGDRSEAHIRRLLNTANHRIFNELACSVDLPLADCGTPWSWQYADPGALLAKITEASPEVAHAYRRAWDRAPSSPEAPWHLVVAFDEFIPGNKLSCEHSRKSMVLSFSFLELGQELLSAGEFWVTPVVARSAMLHEVRKPLQTPCTVF